MKKAKYRQPALRAYNVCDRQKPVPEKSPLQLAGNRFPGRSSNATLQDVKDFYTQWYVPNNVILTIAGDFDKQQAKEWVHEYFDEIKRGQEIARSEKCRLN